jgi:hypothetical protein
MEQKRRKFLKIGLLGLVAGIVKPVLATSTEVSNAPLKTPKLIGKKPIVISTWNHGLAANLGAWEILSKGGKSIDAVEKGVMVTESDATNRSVGIGGMPDRDGHVTLDACIMDEQSRCGAVGCLEGIAHPISVNN